MWPIGRKRVIEMQSCCFGFVRGIAHFCSDTMTLGSGFPLKQGNLGNVIWSIWLQAKWRMFVWHCCCPTVHQWAVCPERAPCFARGHLSSLSPVMRLVIALPQGAASGWDLQCRLLRISWSSEVLSVCHKFEIKGRVEVPERASTAFNSGSPRSELDPD